SASASISGSISSGGSTAPAASERTRPRCSRTSSASAQWRSTRWSPRFRSWGGGSGFLRPLSTPCSRWCASAPSLPACTDQRLPTPGTQELTMPDFAANLSTMFTELPFLARFAAAARCGFDAVELAFPYAFSKEEVARELREHRLTLVAFNLPAGAWEAAERGIACDPDRAAEFREGV